MKKNGLRKLTLRIVYIHDKEKLEGDYTGGYTRTTKRKSSTRAYTRVRRQT